MQLVRNKDKPISVAEHLPHDHKQLIDLLRCQDSRRFIQQQNRRAAVERLDNFHALLLPNAKLPDICARVYAEMVFISQCKNLFRNPVQIGQGASA